MDVGMFQGRKIIVTGGRGYFGHKLRNELKKMGAVVVLFVIFVLGRITAMVKQAKTAEMARNYDEYTRCE